MLSIVANIFYVLIAIAMTVLILLQRGAGANAGSGFGGGASATVFGARGSANFLSRSTAVLAGLFFLLSLGMGMYISRGGGVIAHPADDLGVMSGVVKPAQKPAVPASGAVPPAATTPATPDKPAPTPAAATQQAADKPAATEPKQDGKGGK